MKTIYKQKALLLLGASCLKTVSISNTWPRIFLSIFSFTVLLFSSCGEEIVKPNDIAYQFDSARYTWQVDTIPGLSFGIWAADSEFVCIQETSSLLIYDGNNFREILYNEFSCTYNTVTGIDRNSVYLGGQDVSQTNYNKPKISKWNGTTLEGVIVNDTANPRSYVSSILAINPSEIWLGANNGRVYRYNGSSFQPYYFDTNLSVRPFFRDDQNSLYFCATRVFGTWWQPDSHYVEVRKFTGNDWQIVYSKMLSNEEAGLSPRNVFKGIYAISFNDIHEFDGSNFTKVLNIEPFGLMFAAEGNSINDFICWGTNGSSVKLYSWNGVKWSDENIYHDNLETGMTITDNYIFATVDDEIASGNTYIYKTKLERRK